MIVFRNQLRRMLKSKVQLLFLILFPAAFMSIGLLEDEVYMRTAVVDQDQTGLSRSLVTFLEERTVLVKVTEDAIPKALMDKEIGYAIVMEKGFAERFLQGDYSGIRGFGVEGYNASRPAQLAVEGFLREAAAVAKKSTGDDEFAAWLKERASRSGGAGNLTAIGEINREQSRGALGMMTMGMMLTGIVMCTILIQDRDNRTLYRNMAAPIRFRSYMLQAVSAFLTVSLVQVLYLFGVLRYGFGLYLGDEPLALLALFAMFAVVAVALGLWIASMSKSVLQASVMGLLVITPAVMLGGAFWRTDIVPEVMVRLSRLVPISWLMEGAEELLYGGGWADIGKPMLVMALFALLFFLLGTLRKADLAS